MGLYLQGNEAMLHVAVGPESEGERQMLFDQLDLLRAGNALGLARGCPATWDVATKVLADNLAALHNRSVDTGTRDDDAAVIRKANRATAAKALSRCACALLLHAQDLASLIHDWAAVMGRSLIRHVQRRNQPRKNTRYKPHPSQAYKQAA